VLTPLVNPGDSIVEGQVLAAVVSVQHSFPCIGNATESSFIEQLSSSSLSERYGAAKALGHFDSQSATHALALKANDAKDHIYYVRLEAASSLARRGDDRGLAFVQQCLAEPFAQQRLEAVIVLGELATEAAEHLLIGTLRKQEEHPEIRAGAAWALGELGHESALAALIESFAAVEPDVKIEAARALAKLANEFGPAIIDKLRTAHPDQRPGIAWALSKSGPFEANQLLDALVDDDARRWVAYIFGTQPPDTYVDRIEALCDRDPEVYFAVTVLWQVMNSWIFGLETYG
jgi:HEAT repeat protein